MDRVGAARKENTNPVEGAGPDKADATTEENGSVGVDLNSTTGIYLSFRERGLLNARGAQAPSHACANSCAHVAEKQGGETKSTGEGSRLNLFISSHLEGFLYHI